MSTTATVLLDSRLVDFTETGNVELNGKIRRKKSSRACGRCAKRCNAGAIRAGVHGGIAAAV